MCLHSHIFCPSTAVRERWHVWGAKETERVWQMTDRNVKRMRLKHLYISDTGVETYL